MYEAARSLIGQLHRRAIAIAGLIYRGLNLIQGAILHGFVAIRQGGDNSDQQAVSFLINRYLAELRKPMPMLHSELPCYPFKLAVQHRQAVAFLTTAAATAQHETIGVSDQVDVGRQAGNDEQRFGGCRWFAPWRPDFTSVTTQADSE